MRKLICILMVMALCAGMCLCFTGCNEGLGLGNYSWRHVHFSDAVEGHCATIVRWYDNTTGIEIHTKEYGSLFLSEGSYMLFETDDCPYCK